MKKIILGTILILLYSCTSTEYKGVSGTDQGKNSASKVRFDGTDYYKITKKEPKKTITKPTSTPTKTTTVAGNDKKTTTTTTTTSKPKVTTTVSNEYKKPDIKDTKNFLFPVKNPSIKKAYKKDSYSGIDFKVAKSSDVYAVAPGMVIFAGNKASLGNSIFIYHNDGYVSIYTNLEKILLKKGDYVNTTKDVVAKATDYFGFEFRKRTEEGTIPLDPNQYLKKR